MYDNADICKRCGGSCCKHSPGRLMPRDIGRPLLRRTVYFLRTGHYTADLKWDFDVMEMRWKNMLYIRPAIVGAEGHYFHQTWFGGGQCIFLKDDGCHMRPENRPYECRMLEPGYDYKDKLPTCTQHSEEREFFAAWEPHFNVVMKAIYMAYDLHKTVDMFDDFERYVRTREGGGLNPIGRPFGGSMIMTPDIDVTLLDGNLYPRAEAMGNE